MMWRYISLTIYAINGVWLQVYVLKNLDNIFWIIIIFRGNDLAVDRVNVLFLQILKLICANDFAIKNKANVIRAIAGTKLKKSISPCIVYDLLASRWWQWTMDYVLNNGEKAASIFYDNLYAFD